MKTILIAGNVLLLSIIILMGCHRQNEKGGGSAEEQMYKQCGICDDDTSNTVDGELDGHVVRQLSLAYSRDPGKNTISNTHEPDALSLVFDLKKVKKFIALMEKSTCKVGCDQELGIRFYYIKYDITGLDSLSEEDKAEFEKNLNKHSLAMVPVFKSEVDSQWYDFDYHNVDKGCKFNTQDLKVNKAGVAFFSVRADNHGGVGPPPKEGYYPTVEH